jgi:hypothetical protein
VGLQLSSDGSILAAADQSAVHLLDPATGKELRRFDASWPRFALSPDGRMLAIQGDRETQLRIASVATGEEISTLADQDWSPWFAGVARHVFSPDGRLVAEVGKNRTIEFWEVLSGKLRRRFRGHQDQAVIMPLIFTPDGKTLLSGSEDTTVMLWDVARRLEERPDRLSETELKEAWRDLAGDDAEKADRAIWTLAVKEGQSLPLLREHLRPVRAAEPERLTRLIADLDNDEFAVRDRATQELERLGEQAAAGLRLALTQAPSAEARRRVEHLVDRVRGLPSGPDLLRTVRAVEVVEHVGTPQARELLETLAGGTPEARLTQEAKASLERLSRRHSLNP